MKTVLGLFNDKTNAEDAIHKLQENGFDPKDISILMRDATEGREVANDTGANVAGNTVAGATTGAVVGGLAGLVGAFLIPGIGAFLIGGPVATALGLTGAAATTVSGAATGALAGGLIGALTGLGLSPEEAKVYEEHINEGAILVAVPERETGNILASDILKDYGASDIRTVTATEEYVRNSRRSRTMADNRDTDEDSSTSRRHTRVSFGR